MTILTILLTFICGAVMGILYKGKGITININHNNSLTTPVEYNESMIDELDPDIRRYYDNNNGLNKY